VTESPLTVPRPPFSAAPDVDELLLDELLLDELLPALEEALLDVSVELLGFALLDGFVELDGFAVDGLVVDGLVVLLVSRCMELVLSRLMPIESWRTMPVVVSVRWLPVVSTCAAAMPGTMPAAPTTRRPRRSERIENTFG
jgi:hypothetical protein